MQNIPFILSNFGLSEIESNVYLAALSLGKTNTTQIARKIEHPRAATYFHIRNLREKGLLKESKKGKLLSYTALPPHELANRLDRQVTDLKSLLPQLENLSQIDKETPLIEVMESHKGYFKIYDEISCMPVGSMFRVMEGKIALACELGLLTQEELNIFFTRVVERKIETKGIFTDESLMVTKQKLNEKNYKLIGNRVWHLRTLPESSLNFTQLAFIYGNKVAFMFPELLLTVTIEHREIAKAFTAIFDALFMTARPKIPAWKN